MTEKQFIQSELYKLVKFDYPELKQLDWVRMVNTLTWDFSDDGKKIHIFSADSNYNHVYWWSDEKGILGMVGDDGGDEEFDRLYQEGEL